MELPMDHQDALLLDQFFRLQEQIAEKSIFTFQSVKGPSDSLTIKELADQAKILGSLLQRELAPQQKVLLLFPQGLAYISSLLACWHANVIAVPVPFTDMADPDQTMAKISAILSDSQAECVITDTGLHEFLNTRPGIIALPVLNIDELLRDAADLREARPQTPSELALILYTSGSTAQPKGVMLSHGNVLSQAFTGATYWEIDRDSRIVSWLPQFHSFGICFNIFCPLLTGAASLIMPPGLFVKNPEEWFKTIAAYQATHTAAPNFAFDYCCASIDPASLNDCSLHSLRAIVSGGEPFRKETHRNFIRKFATLGLPKDIFCIDYGSSETGAITASQPGKPLSFLSLDLPSLGERKVQRSQHKKQSKSVVCCGEIGERVRIFCVHPDTCAPCAAGEIGEIWVKSPSVALGYLNRQAETAVTFSGVLSATREDGFFRTGDLGFVENNRLFIVGREKEVIIIHGKNHHPVDIEWTIKKQIPELSLSMAVFACEANQEEKVVVVQEVETSEPDALKKLIGAILIAVSQTHGIEVSEIVFLPKGMIPKTGSGKVQRKLCRDSYLNRALPVLYQYRRETAASGDGEAAPSPQSDRDILGILKKQVLLPVLQILPGRLEEVVTISELGLNSIQYVQIAKGIEAVFGIEFTPVMLFKYARLTELAEYLSSQTGRRQSPVTVQGNPPAAGEIKPTEANEREIAVIGVQLNYPGGAKDPDSFWENLIQSKDCITPVSQSRPQINAACQNDAGDRWDFFPDWGGFIEDVDAFDAPFFEISPLEAESMDPQQRKVMELIWGLIENSGHNPDQLAGKAVGLFVGAHNNDYAELIAQRPELMETYGAYLDSGLHMSLIAHRVSRWFDFHGPSEVINTACSSSLVAVHHAVEAICRGECEMAIAGGINLILASRVFRASHKAGMLAGDGRCKTFDQTADGFVRAEGYGAVLLKPYRQALEDRDIIYGIIRGAVINHDGHSNSLRAPNLNAQKNLIKAAYQKSGLPVETIGYIEAHGTGTALGDPIEIQALQEAFRELNPEIPPNSCGLGTVKTNIGHSESAAGIAGLIKLILAMKRGTLPGMLHFKRLNPYISLDNSPFYLVEQTREWRRLKDAQGQEIPRRAGVSSFGFGGANAHVVVEEYIAGAAPADSGMAENNPATLIPLSAKTPEALLATARRLHAFLSKSGVATENHSGRLLNLALEDLAYTLQVGRAALEVRVALIAREIPELIQKLEGFIQNKAGIADCWQGQVKESRRILALLGDDADSQTLLHQWTTKRKLDKIGQYWVCGGKVAWELLYGPNKPRRVNLPSYPFAKLRYWIAESDALAEDLPEYGARGDATKTPLAFGTLLLQPCWSERKAAEALVPEYSQRIIICCEPDEVVRQGLPAAGNGAENWLFLTSGPDAGGAERFQNYVVRTFREIKRLFDGKLTGKLLLQIVLFPQVKRLPLTGLTGLLKTAHLENPKFSGQLIEVEAGTGPAGIMELLAAESRNPLDLHIRYQGGKRYVNGWSKLEAPVTAEQLPWKDGGVYLISGGAGGLGLIFAREIISQVNQATVILTGRSAPDEKRQAELKRLETADARIEYRQVDVTRREAVDGLIRAILAEHGSLNAVIHSAGVIKDNFILKKSELELEEVLAPKVAGLEYLDQATRDLPLDFLALFSSISASIGNVGQADYAAANAFMDAYAEYRNALAAAGERRGRTLAINWPLWQAGGMRIDPENQRALRQTTGIIAMETAAGIRAFYQAWSSGQGQVMVTAGELVRMEEYLLEPVAKAPPDAGVAPVSAVDPSQLREMTMRQLKELIGAVSKTAAALIDPEEPLESYGIDSVMITRLNQRLEAVFGELSKTLFYEYQTLDALAAYLCADYPQACRRWAGLNEELRPGRERLTTPPLTWRFAGSDSLNGGANKLAPVLRQSDSGPQRDSVAGECEPVAIIGMSGRYPQAQNLEAYWENLKAGLDCISEIPGERWPLEEFYHPDPEEAVAQGKSYSKWGGFLGGFADFDPLFFNISPRDALNLDPQERLFLEICWEVLEDAGYTREQLETRFKRRVGVFAGITKNGFELYGPDLWKQGEKARLRTSFGSVANRISYFLNLQGPSMPIDTMCSSSLTAIHEACEHIRNGECEMAIAGGVNLYLHSFNYIDLCGNRMLASDGKCKSFGRGADGFVPGEGVGAVLLKRLSRAIADGDHIYALIRGTGINHGGKTNGYTVPNPVAQAELIRTVLKRAGVDARGVSYIEAHGTGTELGDPIEITGLTKAFQTDTPDTGFCALGSVKSNIGHLEAAAGIAGIAKILLQLQHRQLVPSLHVTELNPNINFAKTPFLVQRELAEWKRPTIEWDGAVKELPRIAGISSFGAGGANAHVVIEEYIAPEAEPPPILVTAANPALIVLSARDEESLREQARRLLELIENRPITAAGLVDVAYTLQVGREAMEERLAMAVDSVEALTYKLRDFLADRDGADLYRGSVKPRQERSAMVTVDEDLAQMVGTWIDKGKYGKLLELWSQGLVFDWDKLYGAVKPRRVSLPAYPFARKRYWLPELTVKPSGASAAIATGLTIIHPLLQQNISDLSGQRYTSSFSGAEFFLADHVVKGRPVLPGVAYLEMARAAVEQATGTFKSDQTAIRLENVVWLRPVAVGREPVTVRIGLFPQDNGAIDFEIHSPAESANAENVLFCQGRAVLSAAAPAPKLDLQSLRARCGNTLSAGQCYEAFRTLGIDYGPAHQGIETVYPGVDQVLAKLSLPLTLAATKDQFVLHPSLMDAALQAAIGLSLGSGDAAPLKPVLPYALQAMEFFGHCASEMWALIRYADGGVTGDKLRKLDIDLCDVQGNVWVRLQGLASRALEGEVDLPGTQTGSGMLIFHPEWEEREIAPPTVAPDYGEHMVILCEQNRISRDNLATRLNGAHCLALHFGAEGIAQRFQTYATQTFEAIRDILKAKPVGKALVQIVTCNQEERQLFAGLAGLLKTARLENPQFIGQLIEVGPDETVESLVIKLQENRHSPLDHHIRYQDGQRLARVFKETETFPEAVEVPWKDRGIYLITGGAGGLGRIFAQEIPSKVKEATVILTGRTPPNPKIRSGLKELGDLGLRAEYRQADVTQAEAAVSLIESIRAEFGGINGIIHGAGVIRDNFIIKKTREELEYVLAPKVKGAVNLDQASRDLPLDFLVFFASGAGVAGNPGQADYAAANAFMDAYAKYRNTLVERGERRGRTLAVDWPLWQAGGMRVDAETAKLMRQNSGMVAMRTPNGISAFYQSLAAAKDQVMAVEGDVTQLRRWLDRSLNGRALATPAAAVRRSAPAGGADSLKAKTLNFVKQTLVNELKLPLERLQLNTPFEKYGIDSIVQLNLIRELEKVTGELAKTLLFEYSTLAELVEYLLENHGDRLSRAFTVKAEAETETETEEIAVAGHFSAPTTPALQRFWKMSSPKRNLENETAEDIAIIGVSGRYPLANSLEELWEHLVAGDNCLTEVSPERWSVSLTKALAGTPADDPGKRYYGGFLDQINRFDHYLFEVPPADVLGLAPELRLFLEIVWETFEDAGYTRAGLEELQAGYQNGVGVFVGTMYNQYPWTNPSLEAAVLSSNVTDWQIANRTSHFFNLTGPSIAVNTACSSSLTAIHLACESLKLGNCALAVAGGINLSLDSSKYRGLRQVKFLGGGNQSKSFGRGDGYIPGEGVGAVLLKPLAAAIKDGDRIYAVIKSSLVNHSGGRQSYTVPDPKQQTRLIVESIRRSGIDPATIGYVESAANGSELGDPVEVIALNKAFQHFTEKTQFCALGSVKSNLGHLEAASGISQLSKVILQLKHQTLAPTINARPLNPHIKLEQTAFYLQEETGPWEPKSDPRTGKPLPRRSMINSFGAGGAYANLIVEEFRTETPQKVRNIGSARERLLIFSAKTKWSLLQYLAKTRDFLLKNPTVDLADLARSLQRRNHDLEHKAAIIAVSLRELVEKLNIIQQSSANLTESGIYTGSEPRADSDIVPASTLRRLWESKDWRELAKHWVGGVPIDFRRMSDDSGASVIELPKYAFDHQMRFDFNHIYQKTNDEIANEDPAFYQTLLAKVAQGECSEEEFIAAIRGGCCENKSIVGQG
jgi:polyketide synthase PksN